MATMTAGSMLATRKVLGQMRSTPMQKIEDRPDGREVGERGGGHEGLQEARQGGERALQHEDGDDGEDAALAHGCRHGADEQRVDGALDGERRPIAGHAVLDRADDRHGADRDGERRGDEAVDEGRVAVAVGGVLEPLAEAVDLSVEVENLSDERAEGQRDDDERGVDGDDPAVLDHQHAGHRARDADEDDRDGGGFEERVLDAAVYEAAEGESGEAAGENERDVDERAESDHGCS